MGKWFCSTKSRFSLNGGYAQLHAKTADCTEFWLKYMNNNCCFDHSHHVIMIYGREKIWIQSTALNTTAVNQHTSSKRSKISCTKLKCNKYGRIHYLIWLLLGTKEKNSIQDFTVHCQLYGLFPLFSHFTPFSSITWRCEMKEAWWSYQHGRLNQKH